MASGPPISENDAVLETFAGECVSVQINNGVFLFTFASLRGSQVDGKPPTFRRVITHRLAVPIATAADMAEKTKGMLKTLEQGLPNIAPGTETKQ